MFSAKTKEILCGALLDRIPLERLDVLSNDKATIWIKREWTDPLGQDPLRSIKRKPACLLFSDMIEKRYMTGKKLLISATSGNFGIEAGMLARDRELPFYAVVPSAIPEYNLQVLVALGINVIRTTEQETCPREFTVFYVRGYAQEFHHRLVNIEQYYSWLNPLSHTLMTGKEIFADDIGEVSHIVAAVGSCGTICGIKQYLLASGKDVQLTGVQPALHHGVPGTHIIWGNCSWSPENYSPTILPPETIRTADTVDAYAYAAKLWEAGIPAGPSTGMALAEAHRLVREGATGNVVVISPDSNFKYGDLLEHNLAMLRDEILDRYPDLELGKVIERYIDYLDQQADQEWMLKRIRDCYPCAQPGKMFEAKDIEDIVAGRAA